MRKTFFKLAVVLSLFSSACTANVANAQTKFDIMTYTAPQGYKAQQANGTRTFTRVNGGKVSTIILYPSTGSFGNANTDFDRRWKQLITNQGLGGAATQKEAANGDGFAAVTGHSKIQYEGSEAIATLTTVTAKGRLITVLGITNDQSGVKDYQSFVAKIDVDTDSIASSTPSAPRQPTNQQTESPNIASAGSSLSQQIIGRWVTGAGYTARDGAGGVAVGSTSHRSGYSSDLTLQTNGTFFDNGIVANAKKNNKKNCQNESCKNGRYKLSGDIITFTYLNGEIQKLKFIRFDQRGENSVFMVLGSDPYNGPVGTYTVTGNYFHP